MKNNILALKHIRKTYPGVVALNDFSIEFKSGEVHAIVGENGAGKSTLIKTISGAIKPDSGTVQIESATFESLTPQLAKEHGVEVIYQEFNLVGSLSAAENIFLGDKKKGLVNFKEMERKAKDLFNQFDIDINPKIEVERLSTAQKQIVEIAKAISRQTKIIIMDEPSAPLTVSEVACLFKIVKKLRAKGITVLYISHRLDEIFELADRVTVMRDGQYIATKPVHETNRSDLIQLMVGRTLKETFPQKESTTGDIGLKLKGISGNGLEDIHLHVKKGEVLGIGGLVGAGRTELAQLIFGDKKITSGTIQINGKNVQIGSPTKAIKLGIGLIPEDRKHQGCILDMSIKWNISIANIKNLSKYSVVNLKSEQKLADTYQKLLNIKTPSIEQLVKNLSGGNQQKVVLAKTLATNSDIIIFDEPTRGIDVGAKQEIYQLIHQLAIDGKAIIMISSDMEELLGMSDRIVVLSAGRLTGELKKSEFDQNKILELASANI